jgi:hemoglobin
MLLVAACLALASPGAHAAESSLYERIGGPDVIQRIAEQTLGRVAADPAVNQSFDGVNLSKLSVKLARHLCAVTGGNCPPSEDSIKVVHAGLDIGQREFYAMVESLRIACDTNGVGEREKNELLRVLAPMKRDVVTH